MALPSLDPPLIVVAVFGSYGLLSGGYLRWAMWRINRFHRLDLEQLRSSPAYAACNADQQICLESYIHRSYRVADRKRVVHECLSNSLAIVGGGAPMLSNAAGLPGLQKIAGDLAGFTVLVLRVLSTVKSAGEQQRTSYLVSTELRAWATKTGKYANRADSDERFNLLFDTVRTVLDTTMTSFVGAGDQENKRSATNEADLANVRVAAEGRPTRGGSVQRDGRPPEGDAAALSGSAVLDVAPVAPPEIRVNPREAAAAIERAMARRPVPPETLPPEPSSGAIGPTIRSVPVDPSNFAAWQQSAIDDEYLEITQAIPGGIQ
jgi:hypothetical protein